jgi:hypothetical protein
VSKPVSLATLADNGPNAAWPFPRRGGHRPAWLSKLEKGASCPGLEIIAKLT